MNKIEVYLLYQKDKEFWDSYEAMMYGLRKVFK